MSAQRIDGDVIRADDPRLLVFWQRSISARIALSAQPYFSLKKSRTARSNSMPRSSSRRISARLASIVDESIVKTIHWHSRGAKIKKFWNLDGESRERRVRHTFGMHYRHVHGVSIHTVAVRGAQRLKAWNQRLHPVPICFIFRSELGTEPSFFDLKLTHE